MSDIRKWLDKGNKSANRIPALLPLLIRQARLETPITYGHVATELGMHHRGVDRVAGYIGWTLEAIGESRGWKRRPPPPLHSLVINDITRLPGQGINGFMSSEYKKAKARKTKRAVLKAVYAELKDYPHWEELCAFLEIPLAAGDLSDAVDKARLSRGRGGEGPEHKALKAHVQSHPEIAGLPVGSEEGEPEFPLASGDRVDIVFRRRNLRVAVEVKPEKASDGDKLRGVFQCLKYRTVLEAESALGEEPFKVRVLLVLGGSIPHEVTQVANRLGVEVIGGVSPS